MLSLNINLNDYVWNRHLCPDWEVTQTLNGCNHLPVTSGNLFFKWLLPTTNYLHWKITQYTSCIYCPFVFPLITQSSFLSSCQCVFRYFKCVHPPCSSLLPWFGSHRDSFLQIIEKLCICLRIKTIVKHANCEHVPRHLALS